MLKNAPQVAPLGGMRFAHTGLIIFIIGVIVSTRKKTQLTLIIRPLGRSTGGIQLSNRICVLRSIDNSYGPTFQSICGNFVVYKPLLPTFRGPPTALRSPVRSFGPHSTHDNNTHSLPQLTTLVPFGPTESSSLRGLRSFPPPLPSSRVPKAKGPNWGGPLINGLSGQQDTTVGPQDTTVGSGSGLEAANSGTEGAIGPVGPWTASNQNYRGDVASLFPEKRFFLSNPSLSTTKVAIYSNLFTDLYANIGTGTEANGWFTTIMELPFVFCIWIGFLCAAFGGCISLQRLLNKHKLEWL